MIVRVALSESGTITMYVGDPEAVTVERFIQQQLIPRVRARAWSLAVDDASLLHLWLHGERMRESRRLSSYATEINAGASARVLSFRMPRVCVRARACVKRRPE